MNDDPTANKRRTKNPTQLAAERRVLERRLKVSQMRLAGHTNQHQIADALHVDQSTISRDWRWLDAHYERTAVDNIARAKGIDVERCEALITGLYQQAITGSVKAVFATVKVLERRAKLLGLDAPTKIAPTSPDGTEAYDSLSDTDRAERLASLLARIVKRTETHAPVDVLTSPPDPDTDPGE